MQAESLHYKIDASNSVSWSFHSPDQWTATLRSSATGHEQVTIYQMQRIK